MDDATTLQIDGYDDYNCNSIDISGSLTVYGREKSEREKQQMPWIEKYRPKNIEDVILDESTLIKIKKIIEDKDMPNLIITGVPGIGKTTTIKCIANGLYGKHKKDAVLELNASDDRGIKIVDEAITNFCKKAQGLDDKAYAKHKMIILDEADNITSKAQHSINKKMSEYGASTRFAFTCNESTDIIEAIQSRCIILRYLRLPTSEIINRLKHICDKENIKYDNDAISELAMISQGDMRSAINNLQIVYNGLTEINMENIYKVCDKPQPMILYNLMLLCKNKNVRDSFLTIENLKSKGYSDSDIILGMVNVLKLLKPTGINSYNRDNELSEHDKNLIMKKICKTAYIISKGVSTDLQIYSCISAIINSYVNNEYI